MTIIVGMQLERYKIFLLTSSNHKQWFSPNIISEIVKLWFSTFMLCNIMTWKIVFFGYFQANAEIHYSFVEVE